MRTTSGEAYVLPKGTGIHDVLFPYPGMQVGRYIVKTSSEQTQGRLSQVHIVDQRGAASPVHIHADYDESYYLIDGEMTFFLGDEQIEATSGFYMLIPPGVPHAFVVRSDRAEFLLTFAPGGLEAFFVEVGTPVDSGEQPGPTDPEQMARRAADFGAEIIGPPPA